MDSIKTGKFVNLIKRINRRRKESGTIKRFRDRYPIPVQGIHYNEEIENQNLGDSNQ
jgi:hypothetical protein